MDPDADETDPQPDEGPSKSARKRAHKALQELGVALMELPDAHLARVPLPAALAEAVVAGRALRKGARARHVRHLGNLLGRVDEAPVRAALDAIRGQSAAGTARLHRAERWRARLLAEGDGALGELIEQFPHADRQRLRALVRAVREEQARGAAPRRFRELLRFVRDLDGGGD